MPAQNGQAIVLSIKDNSGSPAYQAVGGLRTRRLAFNAEAVDVTNAGSTGRWRELLDAAGVHSMTISGDGIFVDDVAFAEIDEAHRAGSIRDWKILFPSWGDYVAPFKITQFEIGGEYNNALTFSITLESGGAAVFTAA
jgi:TP901-1 family phage major tail protein